MFCINFCVDLINPSLRIRAPWAYRQVCSALSAVFLVLRTFSGPEQAPEQSLLQSGRVLKTHSPCYLRSPSSVSFYRWENGNMDSVHFFSSQSWLVAYDEHGLNGSESLPQIPILLWSICVTSLCPCMRLWWELNRKGAMSPSPHAWQMVNTHKC